MTFRALFLLFALLSSSVGWAAEEPDAAPPASPVAAPASTFSKLPEAMQEVLQYAVSLSGASYRRGGVSPDSGFDCSGYVRYVFGQVAGLTLPHSSMAISLIGDHIAKSELRPGDLVFFRTVRKTISHVGIYLGNNHFIHATSTRTGIVEVSDLRDSYWTKHFSAARRLDLPSGANATE